MEIWKDLPEYENYQVSSMGRVRSKDREIMQFGHKNMYKRIMKGKILKPRMQNCGYLIVWLSHNGRIVVSIIHKLVASAFLPTPNAKEEINHKDGNKMNNEVCNLEWISHSENVRHSYSMLRRKKKGINILCLTTGEIYDSMTAAAKSIGKTKNAIYQVLKGRNKTAGGKRWTRI